MKELKNAMLIGVNIFDTLRNRLETQGNPRRWKTKTNRMKIHTLRCNILTLNMARGMMMMMMMIIIIIIQ